MEKQMTNNKDSAMPDILERLQDNHSLRSQVFQLEAKRKETTP